MGGIFQNHLLKSPGCCFVITILQCGEEIVKEQPAKSLMVTVEKGAVATPSKDGGSCQSCSRDGQQQSLLRGLVAPLHCGGPHLFFISRSDGPSYWESGAASGQEGHV